MNKMHNILSALAAIKPQGEFCTRLTVPVDNLQLKVGDLDLVKLPLTHVKAKALIKQAKPAKFGWKEQTLQDSKVRDTWEVPKSKIRIDKRRWNKTLLPLLDKVKIRLGMDEADTLSASLHNMLVYEPGQFFQAHQDSEKLDGMVATLVVVLPCKHAGGSLVIDHSGKKKRVQTSTAAKDKLTCIAFYADCLHEIKPLTSGYRVALTYNLILAGASAKLAAPPAATLKPLTRALEEYFAGGEADTQTENPQAHLATWKKRSPKWVYLLDHQYTQKGLGESRFKNGDRLRVKAIEAAAARLDMEVNRVLADIQEVWECQAEFDDGFPRRGGYWDYDEEGDDSEEAYHLNGLIERGFSIEYCANKAAQGIDCAELYIKDSDVCWTKASDQFDPFSSEYEGWMGNAGNTLERWYHRAAIVVWRKEDRYALLCEVDPKQAVKELTGLAKSQSTRTEAQCIVKKLLPYWHCAQQQGDKKNHVWSHAVFTLALQIDSRALAQSLIAPLGLAALNAKTAKAFAALEPAYSAKWCIGILNSWAKLDSRWHGTQTIKNFGRLIEHLARHLRGAVIDWLFAYQFKMLKSQHALQKNCDSRVKLAETAADRIEAFEEMLYGCVLVNNHAEHTRLLGVLIADACLYAPLDLAALLLRLDKNKRNDEKWGYGRLLSYVNTRLGEALATPCRKEGDWSVMEVVPCDCRDCKQLSEYLQSSARQTKVWPLAKARRQHIHQTIDDMGVPVTHQTKYQGRPYELVLKKTRALFNEEARQRKKIKACWAKLKVFRSYTSQVIENVF